MSVKQNTCTKDYKKMRDLVNNANLYDLSILMGVLSIDVNHYSDFIKLTKDENKSTEDILRCVILWNLSNQQLASSTYSKIISILESLH